MFSLNGQKVTILGWARSGRASARLAASLGARVFVSDNRPASAFDAESLAELKNYDHELGAHTDRARDAALIVLSPGIPPEIPFLADFKGEVWSELELATRVMPCRIVAVTGTNGKTTTTTLIGKILEEAYTGGRTWIGGNIGVAVAGFAAAVREEDVCVLELSSFQLETIRAFHPRIAVYLNLRSDHLDRYPDFAAYAAAKDRILANMTANDVVILNLDNAHTRALAERLKGTEGAPRVVTVSAAGPADYTLTPAYDERLLEAVKSPENLLSAVAVASLLELDPARVASALSAFQGLPHRIEPVGVVDGATWYNDSKATNVHSVEAALLRVPAPVVLVMGGRDKGENYAELRELVAARCRRVIAYGEAGPRIAALLESAGVPVDVIPSFDAAVTAARSASPGCASVLLSPACSSYDQFKDYVARGDRFRALVTAMASAAPSSVAVEPGLVRAVPAGGRR